MAAAPALTNKVLNATVIVTALGYFIDLFDYYIFLITRITVLKDFGLDGAALTDTGLYLVNLQFGGLLVGGLIFGVLGDKIGRKQSLLGSILLYSLATLASGLTHDLDTFAVLRFIAGVGIAGEVGVGVTMVAETMDKNRRGLGVTVFIGVGLLGVVAAALASEVLHWRTCYIVGGLAGLALLVTRIWVMEAQMFTKLDKGVVRGSFRLLFSSRENIRRYVLCIIMAIPVFFGVSIIATLSPELSTALGANPPASVSTTMVIAYTMMVLGEIVIGLLSQYLQSRRKVIAVFLALMLLALAIGFNSGSLTATGYYVLAAIVGFFMGYWVNFIALSAEQFGTNIRSLAANTIPNFARGSVILINTAFLALKDDGVVYAAGVVGFICILSALFAVWKVPETFGKDLDYVD
ncbi:MAG: MFS transporter [Bdellovibrionales bacterium]